MTDDTTLPTAPLPLTEEERDKLVRRASGRDTADNRETLRWAATVQVRDEEIAALRENAPQPREAPPDIEQRIANVVKDRDVDSAVRHFNLSGCKIDGHLLNAFVRAILEVDSVSSREAPQERIAELERALAPFAEFARQWRRKPLKGTGEAFYGIHAGTEWEAELTHADLQRALAALSSETPK